MEKKKVNVAGIAIGLVAVCLVAIVAVLGVKARNKSDEIPVASSVTDSTAGYSDDYDIIGNTEDSTEEISYFGYETQQSEESTSAADVITTMQQVVTSAINQTSKVTEKVTSAVTTKASKETTTEAVTVPEIDEEETEVAKASVKSVAAASNWQDLPMDMTFAGLQKSGYDVVGLKEYIYNDDMASNCTQRSFGYNSLYDVGANLIDFSIDTVKIKFNYDGKTYRIQLWKGQYISGSIGTVGGEVGIYTHSGTNYVGDHFNCAGSGDELYQEMSILWDENQDGNYIAQFTANYALHWWETGYVDGQLPNKRDSSPLRLLSRMTFKDEEQATLFENALVKAGFTRVDTFDPTVPDTCKRYGKNVIYEWWNVR